MDMLLLIVLQKPSSYQNEIKHDQAEGGLLSDGEVGHIQQEAALDVTGIDSLGVESQSCVGDQDVVMLDIATNKNDEDEVIMINTMTSRLCPVFHSHFRAFVYHVCNYTSTQVPWTPQTSGFRKNLSVP